MHENFLDVKSQREIDGNKEKAFGSKSTLTNHVCVYFVLFGFLFSVFAFNNTYVSINPVDYAIGIGTIERNELTL